MYTLEKRVAIRTICLFRQTCPNLMESTKWYFV